METLAYLHLAYANEVNVSDEPVLRSWHCCKGSGLNWQRLSSWAWMYLLPLALNLAILTVASQALALQRGDRCPAVKTLKEQLQTAGFFNGSPTTEVFGSVTENAVRQFQVANGLVANGIAGPSTLARLQNYGLNPPPSNCQSENLPVENSSSRDILRRGDRGLAVINLKQQLQAAGYFTGTPPTDFYGPVTEEAVRQFQAANFLERNGIAGPTTRRALETYLALNGRYQPLTTRTILRRGDRGEQVRELQAQLRTAGFFNRSPTGIFGPITEQAVRRFQTNKFLRVDGIAGSTTRLVLRNSIRSENYVAERVYTPVARNRFGIGDILRSGDRGEDVRELQEQLRTAGFFYSSANGAYGPLTQDAVRRFQAANYLEASGIAGPTTRQKLQDVVNARGTTYL